MKIPSAASDWPGPRRGSSRDAEGDGRQTPRRCSRSIALATGLLCCTLAACEHGGYHVDRDVVAADRSGPSALMEQADVTAPPAKRVTAAPAPPHAPGPPRTIDLVVPGTQITLQLVHVPQENGPGFRLSSMEIPWELYDHFIYGLDDPAAVPDDPGEAARQARAHAVTRPSRPYISMDRGFGRTNYPAISMSRFGAETFCRWLSALTGHTLRLPTAEEWQHACRLGNVTMELLSDRAWTAENSGLTTHPRGSRNADALGLFDMVGNAAEWVIIPGERGVVRGAVMGGSYLTPAGEAGCDCVQNETPDWNASDPQFPKSAWWLADGGFIGFRVLMEMETAEPLQ